MMKAVYNMFSRLSRQALLCGVLLALLSGCATQKAVVQTQPASQEPTDEKKFPRELQWMMYSVEYDAICQQVYRQAWASVKQQARQTDGKWAVVLDIDETVLNNTSYEDTLFRHKQQYPYFWDEFVMQEKSPPVPGVKAFLDSVRALGPSASVVFITNRKAHLEKATLNNLIKENLWSDNDLLLCRDAESSKENRRQEVLTGSGRSAKWGPRAILALIGDQLGDMEELPSGINSVEKAIGYYLNHPDWGVRYFMLPNPVYGEWQRNYGIE